MNLVIGCENYFCVYWQEGACFLDFIMLDVQGKCTSCILLDFDTELLAKKRAEMLNCLVPEELD